MHPCLGIIYMALNKGAIQLTRASYSHYFKEDYSKGFHLFSPLGRVSLVVAMSLCFHVSCFPSPVFFLWLSLHWPKPVTGSLPRPLIGYTWSVYTLVEPLCLILSYFF